MFPQVLLHFVLVLASIGAVRGMDNATEVQEESCTTGGCIADILSGLGGTYQLLPGVNISSSPVSVRAKSTSEAFVSYLKSLTVHIALYNEPMATYFSSRDETDATARAKRPSLSSSRFRFLSVYTVFAVAFALLSGLIGKAVTLSVIALVIAGIAAARGAGFGANSPANSPPIFDIVRRPHVQVMHTQSAEDVYEAPGTSGGGVSYVYPIRGRAVPVEETYSSHVSVETDGRQTQRHVHIA